MSSLEGALGETNGETTLPAADMDCLMGAVMHGVMSNGTSAARIRSILARVRPVFGADTEYQVHLGIRLDRDPAPLLLDRLWFGEVYDQIEPRPISIFQQFMDDHGITMKARVDRARRMPHRACTFTLEEMLGEARATEIRQRILRPNGFHDVLVTDWMSSPDRLVTLHTVRKVASGFTRQDRALCSLLLRALGPIVDQHFVRRTPSEISRLSRAQLQALHELLSGSTSMDEGILKRLISFFGVASPQALVARFVQPSALEEIEELIRLSELEESENVV